MTLEKAFEVLAKSAVKEKADPEAEAIIYIAKTAVRSLDRIADLLEKLNAQH